MHEAAPPRGHDPLGALVERLQRLGRRRVDLGDHVAAGGVVDRSTASRSGASAVAATRTFRSTISRPRPTVIRPRRAITARASSGSNSITGQT